VRHRTRTVWRVLADPMPPGEEFTDAWFGRAHEAYLVAQALERGGAQGVEVNRVELKPKVSRLDLLNRRGFYVESEVVRAEEWRRKRPRASRARRAS
jgi:hypothetical protein